MIKNSERTIWVFSGENGRFASGVFSSREVAELWIQRHSLSGVLTAYPLDEGVYDWAIGAGYVDASKPMDPKRIGTFSSAYQEHYHFTDGRRPSEGSGGPLG